MYRRPAPDRPIPKLHPLQLTVTIQIPALYRHPTHPVDVKKDQIIARSLNHYVRRHYPRTKPQDVRPTAINIVGLHNHILTIPQVKLINIPLGRPTQQIIARPSLIDISSSSTIPVIRCIGPTQGVIAQSSHQGVRSRSSHPQPPPSPTDSNHSDTSSVPSPDPPR